MALRARARAVRATGWACARLLLRSSLQALRAPVRSENTRARTPCSCRRRQGTWWCAPCVRGRHALRARGFAAGIASVTTWEIVQAMADARGPRTRHTGHTRAVKRSAARGSWEVLETKLPKLPMVRPMTSGTTSHRADHRVPTMPRRRALRRPPSTAESRASTGPPPRAPGALPPSFPHFAL